MIFILHYLLFNAGLPAVIILMTLFLQAHSDASLSEIGALLMALPFVSILIKPLFCALADRHHAHKQYLIIALALMALGYGSLTIAPFYPDFIRANGRLVWYFDICAIIVGFSAFGVVWSLGDALAVNHAQMSAIPWGAYRVWGVVSWGTGGILIGQINELAFLPKYVPAFFVLVAMLLAEILLLAVWPNKHFVMGGELSASPAAGGAQQARELPATKDGLGAAAPGALNELQLRELEDGWTSANRSLGGTLTGSARANPLMLGGAVANIVMEDLGGTLRSSLRLGARPKRAGLEELLREHQLAGVKRGETGDTPPPQAQAQQQQQQQQQLNGFNDSWASSQAPNAGAPNTPNGASKTGPATPASSTFGRATLRRTQMALSRMNSLSAASGHVIADEISLANSMGTPALAARQRDANVAGGTLGRQVMYMSSLASQASLSKATAAARALGAGANGAQLTSAIESPLARSPVSLNSTQLGAEHSPADSRQLELSQLSSNGSGGGFGDKPLPQERSISQQADDKTAAERAQKTQDLQLVLLKLIIRRDPDIWKCLAMFTIFGALLTCHLSYFFVHLERLCRVKNVDFAYVTGGMMITHSISEVFSFTIVAPYFVPLVGRSGALLTCALVYAIRFTYNGLLLEHYSPYAGIPFELAHGIVYGIVYSLITDIACESVNQVDIYFPELIQRGLVGPELEPRQLKLQLRATMQGLFSGAFDGLGNGLGALAGGLLLDAYPFAHLWRICTCVCLVTLVLYSLAEWRVLLRRPRQAKVVPIELDGAALRKKKEAAAFAAAAAAAH